MKPTAVPSERDLDLYAKQLKIELAGLQDDERNAARHEAAATASREDAHKRRLRIGGILAKVRLAWPERGPNAKGWGEYLRAVGISEDSALRWMAEARGDLPHARETDPEAKLIADLNKLDAGAKARVAKALRVNVSGGSGETDRGSWVTSKRWADAVGPWDLDPFSNPRSHIVAEHRCMLEDGGDGLAELGHPGCWTSGGSMNAAGDWTSDIGTTLLSGIADESTRVWIQPPYSIVEDVIAHYGHTRFCALLRLDSSTGWFAALWERTQVIALPKGTREFFEPPDGVEASTNPQPHAFFYADPRDVTPAIAESCIVLSRYEARAHPALQIVR